MKRQFCRLFVAFLNVLLCSALAGGQKPAAGISASEPAGQKQAPTTVERQEKIVRATYEKLTMLNRAARLLTPSQESSAAQYDNDVLRFELGNFRVGPIQQIMSAVGCDLVSAPTGEIIQLTRSVVQHNQEPEQVAYIADWTKGQYGSVYDPKWSVADLLGFEAAKYHNVGEYASYEVTVFFRGKSRTYRALALFHTRYVGTDQREVSFWDAIVGLGGVLVDVKEERRPPLNRRMVPHNLDAPDPNVTKGGLLQIGNGGFMQLASYLRPFKRVNHSSNSAVIPAGNSSSYSENTGPGPIVRTTIEDMREHSTGRHGQRVGFQGTCSEPVSGQQLCVVAITDTYTYENGTTTNFLYTHVNRTDQKSVSATGPRGVEIICTGGRGVATRNCISPGCDFTATLQVNGGTMQMTGGDVWNGQLVHNHTCKIPARTCNNRWMETKCLALGEGWDENTCRCLPETPIIIDAEGNGVSLTDLAGGVTFDLNADGTAEPLSWTTAGSDDGWLVLDRNLNGVIDSGQEMFSNFTAQPTSNNPNGFIALTLFDRPEHGGNNDDLISNKDAVFASLRLWQDLNHNAISEAEELHGLAALGIDSISLAYRESERVDRYGNRFALRATVADSRGFRVGRWAWDVFLLH